MSVPSSTLSTGQLGYKTALRLQTWRAYQVAHQKNTNREAVFRIAVRSFALYIVEHLSRVVFTYNTCKLGTQGVSTNLSHIMKFSPFSLTVIRVLLQSDGHRQYLLLCCGH